MQEGCALRCVALDSFSGNACVPVFVIMIDENTQFTEVGSLVKLIKTDRGLAWGTDAYLLAAYLKPAGRMCELGCGNGVVSLLCASHGKSSDVTAVEIREDMAEIARKNVTLNGLSDKISVVCRDVRDIKFTDPDIGGRFDCVFANPPYIAHPGPSHSDCAEDDARHENHGGIGDFCAAAARLLNFRGSFVCVFRPSRMPELFAAMKACGIEPKRLVTVYPDALSGPSIIIAEGILGGKPGLEMSEPVIFFGEAGGTGSRPMTARMQDIYDRCSFRKN